MSNLTIPRLYSELPFGTSNNRYLSAISIADSPSADAFGRLRISVQTTQFDSTLQYGKVTSKWGELASGAGASSVHVPDESAINMTVGTANGESVVRQTHKYFRYQPGKSQLILQTGTLGPGLANVQCCIGYFNANNGVFFQKIGEAVSVVLRSHVSGTMTEEIVPQSAWNKDKLDGSGRSQVALDFTLSQIFGIDMQWLGVGRVRMGIQVNGHFYYCHEFNNANKNPSSYMTTANLPLRYEIATIGPTSAPSTMKQICSSIASEGGTELASGRFFSIGNKTNTISVTTQRPILTIRPSLIFNSLENRGYLLPLGLVIRGVTNDAYVEVIRNGVLGNAVFAAVSANNSIAEYDVAANTITGGEVIFNSYVSSGAGAISAIDSKTIFPPDVIGGVLSNFSLSLNWDGTTQDTLSIVCTGIGGASVLASALNWVEIS